MFSRKTKSIRRVCLPYMSYESFGSFLVVPFLKGGMECCWHKYIVYNIPATAFSPSNHCYKVTAWRKTCLHASELFENVVAMLLPCSLLVGVSVFIIFSVLFVLCFHFCATCKQHSLVTTASTTGPLLSGYRVDKAVYQIITATADHVISTPTTADKLHIP